MTLSARQMRPSCGGSGASRLRSAGRRPLWAGHRAACPSGVHRGGGLELSQPVFIFSFCLFSFQSYIKEQLTSHVDTLSCPRSGFHFKLNKKTHQKLPPLFRDFPRNSWRCSDYKWTLHETWRCHGKHVRGCTWAQRAVDARGRTFTSPLPGLVRNVTAGLAFGFGRCGGAIQQQMRPDFNMELSRAVCAASLLPREPQRHATCVLVTARHRPHGCKWGFLFFLLLFSARLDEVLFTLET